MTCPVFVNTNISALQSVFDLQNTTNQMDNVLQQLSTGYQINSAADNPAGLAISQEMQTQITGLNQAAQNAQNGISLLQTADGAMANIDTILQSMRSLASQAATGTNNPTDLQALQQEMNQYAQEITNIANTTQFNNLNLLSGAFGGATGGYYNANGQYVGGVSTGLENIQIGANQGENISLGINPLDAASLNVAGVTATLNPATGTNNFSTLVNQSTLGTYVYNIGNGLFTPNGTGTTNEYNVSVASYVAAGVTATTTNLGGAGSITTTATTTGLLSGDFTGTSQVQYTISVVSVVAGTSTNTIYYDVTGSDGFSAALSTTQAVSNATTAAGVATFTFTDTQLAGTTLSLTSNSSAVTVSVNQSATFEMTPAYVELGLYNGTGTSTLVGPSTSIVTGGVTTSVNANLVLYGSNMVSNQPIILGNSNTSDQVTLANLGLLLGQSSTTAKPTSGSEYANLVTLGATPATGPYTLAFTVASDGKAATVAGSGIVTTAATVTSGINISTQGNAETALTVIDQALTAVNAQRAVLGAYQNELQFAVSNAQTGANNLSAAQANIIDTNMALQMANLSKYQVLQQSGIAMLAQADQIPQAILKLIG
ncbi:MAG: hypothetical protein K6V73_00440 [Firmicutes bacterium]|nr:hypothetical protein [Bacillota bacterium]